MLACSRTLKQLTIVLLSAAAAVGSPREASGQSSIEIRVSPRVGVIDPGERLYQTAVWYDSDAPIISGAALRSSALLGFSVDVGSEAGGALLRLSFDRALGVESELFVSIPLPRGFRFPEAETYQTYRDAFPATLTEMGADLILPLRLGLGPLRPFVTAGIGITRYGFSGRDDDFKGPPESTLPVPGTASTRRFGGGVDLTLAGRAVSITVLDAIGRYFDAPQHHVIASMEVWFKVWD